MEKSAIMIGMAIGSTIGGYVPTFFGADAFGLVSVLGGLVGGILGIWLVYHFIAR